MWTRCLPALVRNFYLHYYLRNHFVMLKHSSPPLFTVESGDASDPFAKEPERHPALQARTLKPFNAEPPPSLLVDNITTPTDIFYVRNHLPVPDIDLERYHLELTVNDERAPRNVSFTLNDLKTKFQHVRVRESESLGGSAN